MERKRLSLALTLEAYRMLIELAESKGLTITGWLEMMIREAWEKH